MKKLKKKVFIIISLVFISTTIGMAALNISEILNNWYKNEFNNSTNRVTNNYEDKLYNDIFTQMYDLTKTIIDNAKTELQSFTNQQIPLKNADIFETAGVYINQIRNSKIEILNIIKTDYSQFQNSEENRIKLELDEFEKQCIEELTGSFNNEVNNFKNDAETSKKESVDNLKTVIENAKSEINLKIEENEKKTYENLKEFIDNSIEERKKEMENTTLSFVNQKNEELDSTAGAIVSVAKGNIDDLVNNINK